MPKTMSDLETKLQACLKTPEYSSIPAHTAYTLVMYACHRLPTGGALEALLANDLFDFVGRAESEIVAAVVPIVKLVYNRFPHECHGSREKVRAWINGDEDDG